MNSKPNLFYKVASEDWEFEQVHLLNHRTFAEEIPQHQPNATRRLVDKFHAENTYVICVCGKQVVGMVALRGNRPFSLDQKMPGLDGYLPPGRALCEIRLLAVEPTFRYSEVCRGLFSLVARLAINRGYDLALISGTTRQIKLYRHIGFEPFGPVLGNSAAVFQPMFLSLEAFEEKAEVLWEAGAADEQRRAPLNFLPGPVAVAEGVRTAFEQPPVSHRSRSFTGDMQTVKRNLAELVRAEHVEVLLGSGTLANDAIAAQLSLLEGPGLILSNGEFGERLVDHGRRLGLAFETLEAPWGGRFEESDLRSFVMENSQAKWLWGVHCETSTGVLNDVALLKSLCAETGTALCLDCISAIGTLPVDLRGVFLASGTSGKGLGSYPGLALVFSDHGMAPQPARLPRYLDLGFYAMCEGTPFTQSSNLLYALKAALEQTEWSQKLETVAELGPLVRRRLAALGYELIAPEGPHSPAVVTLALPRSISARSFGWQLQEAGFLVASRSEYLLRRNWLQICLMGECRREDVESLLEHLGSAARAQWPAFDKRALPA